MSRTKTMLLAATVLAGGLAGAAGIAAAQPTYDPAQLPEVKGKVAQYTLTPRGDVDGLILADGTEVHLPPHLSTQLVFSVKPGDAVTVHGLKARNAAMVAGVSVTNDASGVTVTGMDGRGGPGRGDSGHGDSGHGDRGRGERAATMDVTGKVKALLHTTRGDANGVLLDNGAIVRLPPAEATRLAAQLAVGQTLFARGEGIASPLGKLVMARQIGADATKLTDVAAPRPSHDGMPGMMHRQMMHDPMMRGPMMRGPHGRPGPDAPRPG